MTPTRSRDGVRNSIKSKSRTPRACDRCRLKKAKCDGTERCRTCSESDKLCLYTAKRGREARSYYCRMLELTEKAIHRLYWACQRQEGFPGILSDKSGDYVTTSDILVRMGLVGPDLNELNFLGGLKSPKQRYSVSQPLSDKVNSSSPRNLLPKPLPLRTPREIRVRPASRASSSSLGSKPSLLNEQSETSTLRTSLVSPTPTKSLLELQPRKSVPVHGQSRTPSVWEEKQGKHRQPHLAAAIASTSTSSTVTTTATMGASQPAVESATAPTDSSEALALNAFCDFSSWNRSAAPDLISDSHISHKIHAPDSFHLKDQQHIIDNGIPSQMNVDSLDVTSRPPGMLCDSFLAPWPGSLEATYQSRFANM